MTAEMRKKLAALPYAEKLRRVAELIAFSRRFRTADASRPLVTLQAGTGDYVKIRDQLFTGETVDSLFEQAKAVE